MSETENIDQVGKRQKRVRTAAQTAVLMAILTLVSKLFGFAREMIMAGAFGTGHVTDAYVMAIAIPGMVFGGIVTAIDTAYVPLFSKIIETEGEKQGNKFTSEAVTLGVIVALVSSVMGVLFSDQITSIFASGFVGEKAELTSAFLKITFSYVFFTSVAGLLEAFLRYKGVFLAPIIVGYVQNAILILVIMISARYNHYLLVWGWMLAYGVRAAIVWGLATKKRFHYTFSPEISGSIKKIMALSLPVFFGSYINQINAFVDKTLASSLPEGSVAALNFGNLLVGIITGLTISIIVTIIFPKMAQAQALGNTHHFNEMVSTGFNLICIIAIPCSIGAMVYSEQVVQVVYERGAFNEASTSLTATALFFYGIGILFVALNSILVQTFYSMHDMKTPVIYGLFGVIINIILNLVLVKFMTHGGLALATSIAAMCNATMLCIAMRKKHPEIQVVDSKSKLIKIAFAGGGSVVCSKILYDTMLTLIWMPRMILLGSAILAAMCVYIFLLKIMKIEELRFLWQILGR